MIGLSALLLIPGRKLAGGIRGSSITPGRRARSTGRGGVEKEMLVSLRMEFSSVGYILGGIELSHAKMG